MNLQTCRDPLDVPGETKRTSPKKLHFCIYSTQNIFVQDLATTKVFFGKSSSFMYFLVSSSLASDFHIHASFTRVIFLSLNHETSSENFNWICSSYLRLALKFLWWTKTLKNGKQVKKCAGDGKHFSSQHCNTRSELSSNAVVSENDLNVCSEAI